MTNNELQIKSLSDTEKKFIALRDKSYELLASIDALNKEYENLKISGKLTKEKETEIIEKTNKAHNELQQVDCEKQSFSADEQFSALKKQITNLSLHVIDMYEELDEGHLTSDHKSFLENEIIGSRDRIEELTEDLQALEKSNKQPGEN